MIFASLLLALSLNAQHPSPGAAMPCVGALPALLRGLGDFDSRVRELAADLAGDVTCNPCATSRLISTLADGAESWNVRAAAARSLGQLARRGDGKALTALVDAARQASSDPRVLAEVLRAAWSAGDDTKVQPADGTFVSFDGAPGTHVEAMVGGLVSEPVAGNSPSPGMPRYADSVRVTAKTL